MVHQITTCRATRDTRTRFTPERLNTISIYFPCHCIPKSTKHGHLTQQICSWSKLHKPSLITQIYLKFCFVFRNLSNATNKSQINGTMFVLYCRPPVFYVLMIIFCIQFLDLTSVKYWLKDSYIENSALLLFVFTYILSIEFVKQITQFKFI